MESTVQEEKERVVAGKNSGLNETLGLHLPTHGINVCTMVGCFWVKALLAKHPASFQTSAEEKTPSLLGLVALQLKGFATKPCFYFLSSKADGYKNELKLHLEPSVSVHKLECCFSTVSWG